MPKRNIVDHSNGNDIKVIKGETLLNEILSSEKIKKDMTKAFGSSTDYSSDPDLKFHSHPFPHCVITNFINDIKYVNSIRDEVLGLNFVDKSNDLYQFQQSSDLTKSESRNISTLKHALFGSFRDWLNNITKITLNDTVDMSCAKYNYTDVLLCHDDELEGRRIAFVYYLVPDDWTKQDGGCLDLYESHKGVPGDVVKSLIPTFNSLIFFEVTEKSFHQVAEVISKTKTRLTISGWFHGTTLPRTHVLKPIENKIHDVIEEQDEILLSWINPTYLNPEIVDDIQEQFEEDSEIQLKDFILESKYKEMEEAISSCDVKWMKTVVPNQRVCYEADEHFNKDILLEYLHMIKSKPFLKLLTKLTGIEFVDLDIEESSDDEVDANHTKMTSSSCNHTKMTSSSCITNVNKWSKGCYTLLNDVDPFGREFALDIFYNLSVDNWDASTLGGFMSYIARDEDDELLSIHPVSNCLSLVYRDEETMRFRKYINDRADDNCFYEIAAVYYEGKQTSEETDD